MEFIEVVSCGFAPMTVGQLSAGTAFEVKCPFAIDAIAGVYRGDSAGQAIAKRDTSRNAWPPAKLEKRRSRSDLKRDTLQTATLTGSRFRGAKSAKTLVGKIPLTRCTGSRTQTKHFRSKSISAVSSLNQNQAAMCTGFGCLPNHVFRIASRTSEPTPGE